MFFMHIPKTGGMSMRSFLENQYRPEETCPALTWKDLLSDDIKVDKFSLIAAHFSYNLAPLLKSDCRKLVLLRNPLERTLSSLRHARRDPRYHRDHSAIRHLTISELIRTPKIMEEERNVQAAYFCASVPVNEVLMYLRNRINNNKSAEAVDIEDKPSLNLALARLRSFDFVGLTENLSGIIPSMSREMNYHPATVLPLLNDDPHLRTARDELSKEDIEIINQYNDIDIILYDLACRLCSGRVLEHDIQRLVENGIYQIPQGDFEIKIEDCFPGSGWYEASGTGVSAHRWSGPKRYSTLELPLRLNRDYLFSMQLRHVREDDLAHFSMLFNDRPVEFSLEQDGKSWICRAKITSERISEGNGIGRFYFDSGSVHRVDGDLRPLGICVRMIKMQVLS